MRKAGLLYGIPAFCFVIAGLIIRIHRFGVQILHGLYQGENQCKGSAYCTVWPTIMECIQYTHSSSISDHAITTLVEFTGLQSRFSLLVYSSPSNLPAAIWRLVVGIHICYIEVPDV